MMGFQEIGALLRLIFVFGLNIKRMNKAHKEYENNEVKKDFWVGLIFVLAVLIIGIFHYLDII